MQLQEQVKYHRPNSVFINIPEVRLQGFRAFGQWSNPKGPILNFNTHPFPFIANLFLVDNYVYRRQAERGAAPEIHLLVERYPTPFTWYSVFAVPDPIDVTVATARIMPFLRVESVNGNTLFLNEEKLRKAPKKFSWRSATTLNNASCMVVTEGYEFSGRITTIISHTQDSITVADAGDITELDTVLPAPPNVTDFGYIGAFYYGEKAIEPHPEHGVTWHTCFDLHRCPVSLSAMLR